MFREESVLQKVTSQVLPMGLHCVYVYVFDSCVPEIWCRCPFQSQAGQVHGSIHQKEENGHNTGNGVELPWEQHQLDRKNNAEEGEKKIGKKRQRINIHSNQSFQSGTEECILMPSSCDLFRHQPTFHSPKRISKIWSQACDLHVHVLSDWKSDGKTSDL